MENILNEKKRRLGCGPLRETKVLGMGVRRGISNQEKWNQSIKYPREWSQ
jgi:hypothetical protein